MRLRVTASAQFMASAYGCSGEHVRRRDRDTQLETRHPVSLLVHNLAVPANAQAASGRVRPAPFANSRSIRMSVSRAGDRPSAASMFSRTRPRSRSPGWLQKQGPVAKAHFHGVLSISLRLPSALLYAPMRTFGGRGLPKVSGGLRYASVAAMLVLCVAVLSCARGTDWPLSPSATRRGTDDLGHTVLSRCPDPGHLSLCLSAADPHSSRCATVVQFRGIATPA